MFLFCFVQVDLQSSQKENEKLSWDVQQVESLKKDLEGLRKENEALHTSMSTQTSQRDGQSSLKVALRCFSHIETNAFLSLFLPSRFK